MPSSIEIIVEDIVHAQAVESLLQNTVQDHPNIIEALEPLRKRQCGESEGTFEAAGRLFRHLLEEG